MLGPVHRIAVTLLVALVAPTSLALAQGAKPATGAKPGAAKPGALKPGPRPAAGVKPAAGTKPGTKPAKGKRGKTPPPGASEESLAGASVATPAADVNPRAKKAFGAYVNGGLILRPAAGGGASVAIGERHQIDLEGVYGSVTGLRDKSTRIHATTRYRFYPFKGSFNVSLGVAYDMMSIEDSISYQNNSNPNQYYKARYKYDASQIEGELLIGNRWQTGMGLFVGCDWLGMGYRMAKLSGKLSTVSQSGKKPSNAKTDRDIEGVLDGDARFPSYHLLRLSLGWAI